MAFLSQVSRCFFFGPRALHRSFFLGSEDGVSARSRVAWSSVDLNFEDSLEDHGVSRQLVLDKIALEASVWQRCRPCAVTGSLLPLSRTGDGLPATLP